MTSVFGKLFHWLTAKPTESIPAKGREEMALDAAWALCDKYGDILESKGGLVCSETKLPSDKETLKAALNLLYICNKDDPYREASRTCFISLACFQHLEPNEEAALLSLNQEMFLQQSNENSPDKLLNAVLGSSASIPLMGRVSAEMAQLRMELVSRGMAGT